MLDVLQFVFSSFWIFLGTMILLLIGVQGLVATVLGIAAIIRGGNVSINSNVFGCSAKDKR